MAKTTLPTVTLRHPTLVSQPFHREGWVYEEKVDGYRMLAYKDADRVRLASRQGVDHTARFPDIVAALRALEVPTLILDEEIAVFDQKLISRFEWLRRHAPAEICTPPLLPRKGPPGAAALRPPERDRGYPWRSGSSIGRDGRAGSGPPERRYA